MPFPSSGTFRSKFRIFPHGPGLQTPRSHHYGEPFMRLDGKTALIVGASSGIGRAAARLFSE